MLINKQMRITINFWQAFILANSAIWLAADEAGCWKKIDLNSQTH